MRPSRPPLLQSRPFRLYLAGLGTVFAGAWAMDATASMWPMSLASSAALMLSLPFVRLLLRRLRPADAKAGGPRR